MSAEAEGRSEQRLVAALVGAQAEGGGGPAVIGAQARLVVERVQVREAAGQEDEDQVVGPRRKVRPLRGQDAGLVGVRRSEQGAVQGAAAGQATGGASQ